VVAVFVVLQPAGWIQWTLGAGLTGGTIALAWVIAGALASPGEG
jgi:hypothetical protein